MSSEHAPPPSDADPAKERLRRERDLYLRLLELVRCRELEPLLREGLRLIVETVNVSRGYLELLDEGDDPGNPRWWMAHGLSPSEIAGVRSEISRGIIGETLARSEAVVTASAVDDPRFSGLQSVKRARIEAVLCAPIGSDPPRGVLYLQGRAAPGIFPDEDRALAETFCRHLAPFVDRLGRRHEPDDRTEAVRARVRAPGVIGRSAALAQVLEQIALAAPLDVSVLLTGDTGTGKSQLARVLHDNGPRAAAPFVELNCAALPEQLLESELFGALPGAHSTAVKRIEGKVAAAQRGTLFLDEVGELPPGAQAKLLQLLQSRQYYPLGASRPVHADVRIVAATNADLLALAGERRFREDLLYRLQVLPIRVPSLAERRDDVQELAAYFCAAACKGHGLPAIGLSPAALRAVETAAWPGNVRQLASAVEAAAIRAVGEGAHEIEPRHIFPQREVSAGTSGSPSFQEQTRRFQERLLRDTLEATDWSIVDTARRLDLARSYVYKLINAFDLRRSTP
ncbi:MAG: sigma-54-dependent Fis family transcriptional regulator [Deltaproteobacteria bacterium]|nr:sigma-54-dependent Fis family transcriptional regulator [Deltaproteobacteria bacterium]